MPAIQKTYQRDLPLIIGTLAALIVIANYFFSTGAPMIKDSQAVLVRWSTIAAAFALLVGAVATVLLHVNRMTSKAVGVKRETKGLSAVAMIVMVIFILVGVSSRQYTASPQYQSLYTHIAASLSQAVRGIAFFSCLLGAYRAMRVHAIDSALMLVGAAVFLVRSLAAGLYYFPAIQPIGDWFLQVPTTAAARGGILAAAIGALILTIRVLGGKETSVEEMVA